MQITGGFDSGSGIGIAFDVHSINAHVKELLRRCGPLAKSDKEESARLNFTPHFMTPDRSALN